MLLITSFFFLLTGVTGSSIVGGKQSSPHSWPYMVSVQRKGEHRCGGFLIRNNFVLTAAHCLNMNSASKRDLEVVVGAHNLTKAEPSQQRIQVRNYFQHPKYKQYTEQGNWKNLSVDIMLLKLKSKAKLNKFVKIMELPMKNDTLPGKVKCKIAGWGMRRPKGQASNVLYETSLSVLTASECEQRWALYFDSEYMMCTQTFTSSAFCQGDSGGPLMCNTKPKGLALYTYPEQCNNPQFPGIYLKIPAFIPWITKTMNKK